MRRMQDVINSVEIKISRRVRAESALFFSTSTPSTRRLLDGVAIPVPRRSTEPGRPRHRREVHPTLVDFHTGRDAAAGSAARAPRAACSCVGNVFDSSRRRRPQTRFVHAGRGPGPARGASRRRRPPRRRPRTSTSSTSSSTRWAASRSRRPSSRSRPSERRIPQDPSQDRRVKYALRVSRPLRTLLFKHP